MFLFLLKSILTTSIHFEHVGNMQKFPVSDQERIEKTEGRVALVHALRNVTFTVFTLIWAVSKKKIHPSEKAALVCRTMIGMVEH
jgi:hypothetical protein